MHTDTLAIYEQVASALYLNKQRQADLDQARSFVDKLIENPQPYNGKTAEEVLELAKSSLSKLERCQEIIDEKKETIRDICKLHGFEGVFEVAKMVVVDEILKG